MARVGDLVRALDAWCPPAWAEDWDNVGLLLGDPEAEVHRCYCALDADAATLAAAAAAGAQMVVTHHPLPFRPARRLRADEEPGRLLLSAARWGLALYAAHTNLDVHPEGVNAALARALDLRDPTPLCPVRGQALYALEALVPAERAGALRRALEAVGARPVAAWRATLPAAGDGPSPPGRDEAVRLEARVDGAAREAAVRALLDAHPPARCGYSLVRLDGPVPARALGLVGRLARPTPLAAWAAEVAARLRAPAARFAGPPERPVERAAVCGGAGAELWREAQAAGADVLVTADVRYHQLCEAQAAGVAIIDAGHRATEAGCVPVLAATLRRVAAEAGLAVEVLEEEGRDEPWRPAAAAGALQGHRAARGAEVAPGGLEA